MPGKKKTVKNRPKLIENAIFKLRAAPRPLPTRFPTFINRKIDVFIPKYK